MVELTKVYFLSKKVLYSNKSIDIKTLKPIKLDEIKKITSNFEKKTPKEKTEGLLNTNQFILELLNKVSKDLRIIEISKTIDNFNEIKILLEDKFKKNKSYFKKAKNDDFDFIEKTSQFEVITEILKDITKDEEIFNLKLVLKRFCENNIELENLLSANNKLNFNKLEVKVKLIKEDLANFKENNISILIKEIERIERENLNLKSSNKNLKHILESKLALNSSLLENNKYFLKLENLKTTIKKNEFEIKIIQSRIKATKAKIKTGQSKNYSFFPYFFSLGLIHWTRFSDNKYLIFKSQIQIEKLKMKNLILKKKKEDFSKDLTLRKVLEKEENEKLKNNFKELNIKISENSKQFKKNVILILNIKKKLEKNTQQFEKLNKNYLLKLVDINKFKEDNKLLTDFSLKNISKKINEIQTFRNKNIADLKEKLIALKKQTVNIEGDFIIEY